MEEFGKKPKNADLSKMSPVNHFYKFLVTSIGIRRHKKMLLGYL